MNNPVIKGFENPVGHNNCFLNVVLQSLWHLSSFREKFSDTQDHNHHPENCIFCSLKVIFTQYQFGEEGNLPPDALRNDLSRLFAKDSKFQLGQLDDAAEALDSILESLHETLTKHEPKESGARSNQTCEPPCLVHKVFGLSVVEQICCNSCNATSEPTVVNEIIDYVPAAALRQIYNSRISLSFSELLHSARSEQKPCSNSVRNKPNHTVEVRDPKKT